MPDQFDDPGWLGRAYDRVSGDEDARVCRDIPDSACRHQPRNFFAYLISNVLSKLADELSSARLVLPWLMGALGAPSALVGFLVPIREAGVLLPQLLVAAWVRRLPQRKAVWLLGGLLSGLALLLMALATGVSGGTLAGVSVLGALVVYSLARGLCSVAAKDVLGNTVSRTRRGTLLGYASSLGGGLVLIWGGVLWALSDRQPDLFWLTSLLVAAGLCWFLALFFFNQIIEEPGATDGGGNALTVALGSLSLLFTDGLFQRFVLARAAMLGVALAGPFMVLLVQQASGTLTELGSLVIVSGLASMLSAPVWGRWSDRSSRAVMQLATLVGGLVCLLVALLSARAPEVLGLWGVMPLAFFVLTLSHSGMRIGRKAYLVDMADQSNRATYVAVSNTLIGLLMLLGGLVGWLGDLLSIAWVLAVLGSISLLAVLLLHRMPNVTRAE